jgi:hypothetical protein
VHPKTAQKLARHSTTKLTMDRYSHTMRGSLATALNMLPDLLDAKGQNQKITGTDDVPANPISDEENRLALCLAHLAEKSSQKRSRTQRVKGKTSADDNRGNPQENSDFQGEKRRERDSFGSFFASCCNRMSYRASP